MRILQILDTMRLNMDLRINESIYENLSKPLHNTENQSNQSKSITTDDDNNDTEDGNNDIGDNDDIEDINDGNEHKWTRARNSPWAGARYKMQTTWKNIIDNNT